MKPIYLLPVLLFILADCGQGGKPIEIRNSQGVIVQRITITGDTSKGRNGIYEKFDEKGRQTEYAEYKDGLLHGERRIYEDGRLYSIEHHNADQVEGPYKVFFPNGQLQLETQYVNNEISGELKGYYPSGKLKEIVQMKANQENGAFTEFYENGNKKAEGTYKEGAKEDGLLLMYDTTGVLIRKMECADGICHTIWSLSNTNSKQDNQ